VADLDELAALFAGYLTFYQVTKPLTAVREFLAARLRSGDSTLLLARDDQGVACGFVQLYPFYSSLALEPAWLLSDLYVSETVRRQGIGEALMNAARAHAEAGGACGLQLETAKSNLPGQALYERLGYVRDKAFYTSWLGLP
jgi:ribosomal protein S18 acetylase RimI-like enzyme